MDRSIDAYVALLKEYNDHTNIYSKNAYDHLSFHIENSLKIRELIDPNAKNVLDIGSGSGLPSIPLAIENKNLKITAVESKSRKTKFLSLVKNELNLANLTVVTSDIIEFIHKYRPNPEYITAKAFAPIDRILPLMKLLSYSEATLIVPISDFQREILEKTNYPPHIANVQFTEEHPHYFVRLKLKNLKR